MSFQSLAKELQPSSQNFNIKIDRENTEKRRF